MKAAVLYAFGEAPRYVEFPDPSPAPDDLLVPVKAVALENFDRALAKGTHYAHRQLVPTLPAIVGTDGVGMREDGKLIGFGGLRPPYGSMAEKAAFPKTHHVLIPDGVDAATAATVPSSALTAFFPLKFGAKMQPGETVLINGATGFAGKLAVQIARLLGAQRIIGTGRDAVELEKLQELGISTVIDLKKSDSEIVETFRHEIGTSGCHVILDFLWGHPTELLLEALTPQELSFPRHSIRLVQIGEMAGPIVPLTAGALRTSGLEILGASAGIVPEAVADGTQQVWEWIKGGKLRADIEKVPLSEVENAWKRSDVHGKRIVIVP